MKNPKRQTVEKIKNSTNKIFDGNSSKFIIEDYYIESEDSSIIMNAFYSSIGNNVTYYKNGLRQKYIGVDAACSTLKNEDIIQNFDSLLVVDSDTSSFKDMISYFNFKDLKSKIKLVSGTEDIGFKQEQIYVVYFWSNFYRATKSKRNSFARFEKKLEELDNNIRIIRINCDLVSENYGNFKLKFKKAKNTDYYEVFIERK